jgi:hypothetical protein
MRSIDPNLILVNGLTDKQKSLVEVRRFHMIHDTNALGCFADILAAFRINKDFKSRYRQVENNIDEFRKSVAGFLKSLGNTVQLIKLSTCQAVSSLNLPTTCRHTLRIDSALLSWL